MSKLFLAPPAVARVRDYDPWVLAKDVIRTEGRAPFGATVTVCGANGEPLAKASISPESKIRARIWHWSPNKPLDHAWFKAAVAHAYQRRVTLGLVGGARAYRLIAAEGDSMPGVVIDNYAGTLVVQLTSAGAEKWRDAIVQAAVEVTGANHVYERSDAKVREVEGLARRSGVIMGDARLGSREQPLTIQEGRVRYFVDIQTGHKTGFYLDQAQNRALIADLAKGKTVLNCFSYTGGFGVAAACAGALRVVNIDSSAPALSLGELAMQDHPAASQIEWRRADVKKALAGYADDQKSFDVVILDPPKLAPYKASARKALGVYGELNRRALSLLPIGGMLASFSCSSAITMTMFRTMLTRAAGQVGVQIAILTALSASADHPTNPALADDGYLKGLLVTRLA